MAKRQRGGARPGQRAPLQRGGRPSSPAPTPKPAAAPRPTGGLSDDELARAAALEAQIVEEERAAAATMARGRDRRRPAGGAAAPSRPRATGMLTAAAEDEYRYAVGDLRKIAVVFTMIFGLLIASWLLIVVAGVGNL